MRFVFISIALVCALTGCLFQPHQESELTPEPPSESLRQCSYESPFGFHTSRMFPTSLVNTPRSQINPNLINFYEDAQSIGVGWERPGLYCHWIIIQPTREDIENNIYHWESNDAHYRQIPETMCILGNIGLPERVYPEMWQLKEPENEYTVFVKAVVERYDGDGNNDMPGLKNPILYWQVENEPDLHSTDWKGYANIQKITYTAIKEACPECTVLMGGMSGGGIPVFEEFYRPILEDLKGSYIDIFDFHWYGNALGDYKEVESIYEIVQTALSKNGYTADVWITETGTYSGTPFRWTPQTETDQARDVVKRYIYPLSLGVKKVFWAWGLQEGFKHTNGFFDHTGFVYDGEYPDDLGRGEKKLSYYTFRKMTETLQGVRKISLRKDGEIYVATMIKDGGSVYCVWWDFFDDPDNRQESEKEITVATGTNTSLMLIEAVPHSLQGKTITSYKTAFATQILQPEGKSVTFTIGKNPVFLEEIKQNSHFSGLDSPYLEFACVLMLSGAVVERRLSAIVLNH